MEKKQLSTHSNSLSVSPSARNVLAEMSAAQSGNLIKNATDVEIRKAIGYGLIVSGIPRVHYPQTEVEKMVILGFIRKIFPNIYVYEINLAFDFAVEKRIRVDLATYGASISSNYIATILRAYIEYKSKMIKQSESENTEGMTNNERAAGIFSLLKQHVPDFYENLKKGGEKKIEPRKKREYTEEEAKAIKQKTGHTGNISGKIKEAIGVNYDEEVKFDADQRLFREWDELREKKAVPGTKGAFIEYEGKIINQQEFIELKTKK